MLDGESLKSWLAQILGDYPSTLCARRFLPGACHVVLMMCVSALLLYYMFLPSLQFVFQPRPLSLVVAASLCLHTKQIVNGDTGFVCTRDAW